MGPQQSLVKILFIALLAVCVSAVDRTIEVRATGKDVVDATLTKLKRSQIFTEDFSLFSRLAYLQTQDGANNETFANGWFGGMWNLTDRYFYRTGDPVLAHYHAAILEEFGIDWRTVTWSSLQRPLHAAIASRLLLRWEEYDMGIEDGKMPSGLAMQASVWANLFHNWGNFNENIETFINVTRNREGNVHTCTGKVDLVVLLDGYSSPGVGNERFEIAKNFIASFISSFNIEESRIGFFIYTSDITEVFGLQDNYTTEEMEAQVRNVTETDRDDGNETNTYGAISAAIEMFQEAGSRQGIPKILTVFLHSVASEDSLKNETLEAAAEAGIVIFPVAIDERYVDDPTQLQDMAYSSDSSYYLLGYFGNDPEYLQDFRLLLKSDVCKVHQVLVPGVAVIESVRFQVRKYFKIQVPMDGITLLFTTVQGSIQGYYSWEEKTPNSAIYDGILQNCNYFPGIAEEERTVYFVVEGVEEDINQFVLQDIPTGNGCLSNSVTF